MPKPKLKRHNIKNFYYFVRSKAKKIGKPFDKKSKKGRNFAISPYDYAAMFIISTFFDWSLRDDEFFSEVLCGKHVDHSTFGKAFAKIPYYYIKWLIFLTRNYIRNLIDEKPVLISDSTGVRTDRLYIPLIFKCKYRKRKVIEKLNILAEYYPKNKLIVIANADSIFRSDAIAASIMLDEIETKADYLFADAAHDSEELLFKCYRKKIKPVIRIRKYHRNPRKYRRKVMKDFDENAYRSYRGVIEGIFGGLENRRLLFTRYKKKSMRIKHVIAMAAVHNLRVCMAITFIIWIYSTNPNFL